MGSTWNIYVKSHFVSLDAVNEIAKEFSDVRRDDYGDILSGGNRFVHVTYDAGETSGTILGSILETAKNYLMSSGRDRRCRVNSVAWMLEARSDTGHTKRDWSYIIQAMDYEKYCEVFGD